MTGELRAARALGLLVPRTQRSRFVEEWSALLLEVGPGAARRRLFVTAVRVAAYLLVARLRRRRAGRRVLSLTAQGVLVGFVVTMTDVPVGLGLLLVPVLVVVPRVRLRAALRSARA